MLERCYSNKNKMKRFRTYYGCTTHKKWHNFQRFSEWYCKNYVEYGTGRMCLDKDILIKGNKEYSPDTCVIVDNRINCLFTKTNSLRGEYPIGVYYKKKNKKFVAQCSMFDGTIKKQKYLGLFNTSEEAFYTYKHFKEAYIKQVADEYKEKYITFPSKLYDAMYTWEVEITD